MSDYKDTLTRDERRYVYAALLLFLLGFGGFLVQYVIGSDAQFNIGGQSGTLVNLLGALLCGYGLSCEATVIHYILNKIRANTGATKAIYILLFVPELFVGLVIAAIMTIPYCLQCAKKIRRIKMDNGGVYLRWQRISLLVLGVMDLVILVAYFIVVQP